MHTSGEFVTSDGAMPPNLAKESHQLPSLNFLLCNNFIYRLHISVGHKLWNSTQELDVKMNNFAELKGTKWNKLQPHVTKCVGL